MGLFFITFFALPFLYFLVIKFLIFCLEIEVEE